LIEALWGGQRLLASTFSSVETSADAFTQRGRYSEHQLGAVETRLDRTAFAQWLRSCVDQEFASVAMRQVLAGASKMEQVWHHLVVGHLHEACRLATESGDLHLATLIAQCTTSLSASATITAASSSSTLLASSHVHSSPQVLHRQIDTWQKQGAWGTFPLWHQRVYRLLSRDFSDLYELSSANPCLVNFIRGLAAHFWIGGASLQDMVNQVGPVGDWIKCFKSNMVISCRFRLFNSEISTHTTIIKSQLHSLFDSACFYIFVWNKILFSHRTSLYSLFRLNNLMYESPSCNCF
jgi:hypothetical protein